MAPSTFIATKEHRRFTEFANAVRRQRTIGICYGQAGIGKTLSAKRYANWSPKAAALVEEWGRREDSDLQIYKDLAKTRTVFFTPGILTTPKQIKEELSLITNRTSICIHQHLDTLGVTNGPMNQDKHVELIIVDESERLNATALEVLRDRYDRNNIALMLIGMPCIEKQFSRYPQLYSRVGFAHEYRPLAQDELHFVLQRKWRALGKTLDLEDFTDTQAVAAIARITRGNFRLIDRLFAQMQRVMKINELDTITDDVVEAARSTLVIGIG
ncbi:AAA family ATPase [Glutamicibacter arilaitensis]|uniref:ATP-binding protein n=1 Tax=Glutamicibacter arilaitensis TaxID=256701 RepID=A0A4Y8TSV7_9MICC|nr:AAA family ATPase [Glutamicibacter arilaitensis]TFH54453.1 ATP-binding protein [Glutamicibacter arilaitensis]